MNSAKQNPADEMRAAFEAEFIGYEFPDDLKRSQALNLFSVGYYAHRKLVRSAPPVAHHIRAIHGGLGTVTCQPIKMEEWPTDQFVVTPLYP